MNYSPSYRGAVKLQKLILVKAAENSTKSTGLAALSKAYADLESLKRRMLSKPEVKPVDLRTLQRHLPRHLTTGLVRSASTPQVVSGPPSPDNNSPAQPPEQH